MYPKGLEVSLPRSLSPNAEFRYETADELLAHLKTFESKKLEEKKQQQDLAKSVTELTSEAISPVPAKRANARRLEPRQPEKGTSAKECGWLYQRAIWGGLTLLFLLFFLFWPSKIVKIEDFATVAPHRRLYRYNGSLQRLMKRYAGVWKKMATSFSMERSNANERDIVLH